MRGVMRLAARINRHTVIELAVNLLLPWLAYELLVGRCGEFGALVGSAAPPLAWSLYEVLRFRALDALSLLVLTALLLSAAALALGGSPRLLLVRENLFSIPLGLLFLVTAPMRRPLIYFLAGAVFSRQSPERRAAFETAWQLPHVLHGMRVMCLVWGLGMLAQGVVLGWLAWTWPIPRYLLLSTPIGYGMIGALALWTVWYQRRLKARTLRQRQLQGA